MVSVYFCAHIGVSLCINAHVLHNNMPREWVIVYVNIKTCDPVHVYCELWPKSNRKRKH